MAEAERVLADMGKFVMGAYRETGMEKGEPVPIPFSIFIGKHTFDRVLPERADGMFLAAKQP